MDVNWRLHGIASLVPFAPKIIVRRALDASAWTWIIASVLELHHIREQSATYVDSIARSNRTRGYMPFSFSRPAGSRE